MSALDDDVGALLWQARHEGIPTMAQGNQLLYLHPGSPASWDADAFCALVHELQQHHPDGHFQGGATGWCNEHWGGAQGLRQMVAEKKDDAAFTSAMAERWRTLPPFWGLPIAVEMAKHGMVDHEALTDEELQTLAAKRLQHAALPRQLFGDDTPTDRWGRALAAAAAEGTFTFDRYASIEEVLPHATPTQRLEALGRMGSYLKTETLAAMVPFFEAEAVESALASLPDDDAMQPRLSLTALVLTFAAAEGRDAPACVDASLPLILGGVQISAYNGIFEPLLTLPVDRLGPALIAAPRLHWDLITKCPTEAMADFVVERMVHAEQPFDVPGMVSGWKPGLSPKSWALYDFLELLGPRARATLDADPTTRNRRYFLQAILLGGSSADAPRFVTYLTDEDEAVRALAIAGLAAHGGAETAPLLAPLVHAATKGPRLAAAEAMAAMTPSAPLHALAQERLGKERVKAVKALLQSVREPTDDAEGALVASLQASDGASWTEHTDDPDALVRAFWNVIAAAHHNRTVTFSAPIVQAWREAMPTWKEAPEAFAIGCKVLDSGATTSECLDVLAGAFPDEVFDLLAKRLPGSPPKRPAEMGKSGETFNPYQAVAWLCRQPLGDAGPALVAAMGAKKKVAAPAVEHLTAQGAASLPWLVAGLEHGRAGVRAGALAVLDALRLPESLEPLVDVAARRPDDAALLGLVATLKAADLRPESFPNTEEGDGALAATLAALPSPAWPWKVAEKGVPSLTWARGGTVGPGAQRWLLATVGQQALDRTEAALWAVRDRLDDASCTAVLDALVAEVRRFVPHYVERNGTEARKERFRRACQYKGPYAFASGWLGDDAMLDDMARSLELLVGDTKGHHGRDALEALARRGNGAAIRGLEWASRRADSQTIKRRCSDRLEQMAQERGVSLGELLDEGLSDLGFDADGKQALPYGGRTLTLVLTEVNGLAIEDATGKVLRSLPKARKDDDVEAIQAAKKQVRELRKTLKATHAAQKRRLEDYLAVQRVWRPEAWRARFADHPLMRAYTRTLVWEGVDEAGASTGSFLLTESADLMDVELEEVPLPTGGVRLLHPSHVDADTLAAWSGVLEDHEVLPFFEQLSRPVFPDGEALQPEALRFAHLPSPVAGPFMGAATRCGYRAGARGDGGNIYATLKSLGPFLITVEHEGYWPQGVDYEFDLQRVVVTRGGEQVAWEDLSPVLRSELRYDLHRLTGAA